MVGWLDGLVVWWFVDGWLVVGCWFGTHLAPRESVQLSVSRADLPASKLALQAGPQRPQRFFITWYQVDTF